MTATKERLTWVAIAAIAGILLGYVFKPTPDINDRPRYGSTGLPSNCRALIAANVQGYRDKRYSADEVMTSIERNCGLFGHLWDHKP